MRKDSKRDSQPARQKRKFSDEVPHTTYSTDHLQVLLRAHASGLLGTCVGPHFFAFVQFGELLVCSATVHIRAH